MKKIKIAAYAPFILLGAVSLVSAIIIGGLMGPIISAFYGLHTSVIWLKTGSVGLCLDSIKFKVQRIDRATAHLCWNFLLFGFLK